MSGQTREAWLERAALILSENIFAPAGYHVPKVRISIGFTGSKKTNVLGACWSPEASDDKLAQIFITPTTSDSLSVTATLVHELVHAVVGNDKGHGPVFKRCALKVGLEGKMRATKASQKLEERLNVFLEMLGPIPHSKLNMAMNPKKKQTTRLLKAVCPSTEYTVRITKKWVDECGAPICACCQSPMQIDQGGDDV